MKIKEGSTAKIAKTIVGFAAGAAAGYATGGAAAPVAKQVVGQVAGEIAETITKSFEENQAKVFSQLMTHHVNFVYEACMVRDFKAPRKAK